MEWRKGVKYYFSLQNQSFIYKISKMIFCVAMLLKHKKIADECDWKVELANIETLIQVTDRSVVCSLNTMVYFPIS